VHVGILGGGLTGLVVASRLPDAEVLEKADHLGGLCTSLKAEGFTFDQHGSHILFSRQEKAMEFYRGLLGDNLVTRRRNTKVFYKGRFVKYPFENGLSDLPVEENYECLVTFLEAHFARLAGKTPKPANFRDWMYAKFGKGITEKYLLPYNEKIWKTPSEQMGMDWVEGRVPDPKVRQQKYEEIQRILWEDEPEIWPYYSVAIYAISDKLRNFEARRDYYVLLYDVSLA